jgi:predicted nucleotidyltransferase
MAAKLHPLIAAMRKCRNAAGLVRPSAIRRLAQQIAEKFQPEKIILFGSYAYGTPDEGSDVDILVVMPAKNESSQRGRIRKVLDCYFPLDLIVRTPENLRWRLEEGDWFLLEIMERGKVLYEKTNRRVGAKSRKRLPRRDSSVRRPPSST